MPLVGDDFRLALESDELSVCTDLRADSPTLLLAFGGIANGLDVPPFEFFSLTGDMPIKRAFIRDLRQSWYHRGLPGHGSSIAGVAEALAALIDEADVDRVVAAGTSAGGYAAILFGRLLGADTALCFGAQTVIDPATLREMGDQRWMERLEGLAAAGALDGEWTDLRDSLTDGETATTFELFYDESFMPDRKHAERISGAEGVLLRPICGGEHQVARQMRESGDLEGVLTSALHLVA